MNSVLNEPADYLIVGSGAGGSAAAYALARSGRRVILLEKGERLPDDGSTLNVEAVLREGRFKSHETWLDRHGERVTPEEFFNLGGKTRWYGAALLRFTPSDFVSDEANKLLPWPFSYDELTPYYKRIEQLLGVRHFDVEPELKRIAGRLRAGGWSIARLPLGLSAQITDNVAAATHFDGFAIPNGLKADAQHRLLDPTAALDNLTIVTHADVAELLPEPANPLRVSGARLVDGRIFLASTVLLAAGALHSPRLLQRYVDAQSLDGRLPAARNIGRNFKRHLLTAVLGFSLRVQNDHLRKTLLLTHPQFCYSSVQPLGGWIDREIVRLQMPSWLPKTVVEFFARRVYGFFLQTEDGSDPANRVVSPSRGEPVLDYAPERLPQAAEHGSFVRRFMFGLLRAGLLPFKKTIPLEGTAHACGTLAAGIDPAASVVDGEGRVHGFGNLYVVDGSVLPRSSRMNPALTIYAWSLRVAERLLARDAKAGNESRNRSSGVAA
jgi:choline dehydrogenase-like flavoprotein